MKTLFTTNLAIFLTVVFFPLTNVHAFLNLQSGITVKYEGTGIHRLKSRANHTLTYTTSMSVNQVDESNIEITQKNKYSNGKTTQLTYLSSHVAGNFYNILDADHNAIGEGYCYPLAQSKGKKCHYFFTVNDERMDILFTVKDTQIFMMGSKMSNNDLIIWREGFVLNTKFPTP